jgi:penicillin G amidase
VASRNSAEFREALRDVVQICLNYVFADREGNIGWHVTGRLPIRRKGEGRLPQVVQDGKDNWRGWIPFEQMPHAQNPSRGWLGSANHKTVTDRYPYYYSDFFSTPYRKLRIRQLLQEGAPLPAEAHWRYQRDIVNLKAARVAPIIARSLMIYPETERWGRALASWNHEDAIDQVAPTLFHAIFNEFAHLVFVDELGEEVARRMLSNTYYWEQRLIAMIEEGDSVWFDDVRTPDLVETQEVLWRQAALNATERLQAKWGDDMSKWRWGDIHRYEFISPIARKGAAKRWLGGGSHPAQGSGDTLSRAKPASEDLTEVSLMASLRMVADLGDPDKVLAVLPGGVTGRQFHPHTTDQIEPFIDGDLVYWWFSDKAIRDNARHELILNPGQKRN